MKRVLQRTARVIIGILAVIVALVLFAAAFFAIAESVVDFSARTLPSYPREDILPTLGKEVWTDEDYRLLYRQTGLGKSALDELKGETDYLLSFQDALFYEGEIEHEMASFTTPHDRLVNYFAPMAPLQNGDVLVTSSCHTFGWRNGHSALVIFGETRSTLQSVAPGYPSSYGDADWFATASDFIVLRLKNASEEERAEIALWSTEHLLGVEYSLLVGFFGNPKDQGEEPKITNCSHLVWQAYKHFGYDIDPDGGPVCTSRDIANSPYFEVVQVYGFDPEKLW